MSDDVRQRVLFGLAKRDVSDLVAIRAAITEAAAEVLGVERVSLWRVVDDRELVCEDVYVRGERRHAHTGSLTAELHPSYFAALREQRTLTATDALSDPRTRELAEPYLRPLGITSMMDVPIWHRGRVHGVLCHESTGPTRHWSPDDVAFVTNLADIVSISLEAAERRCAEQRWWTVVQAIPEGVMVVRPTGRIERMNATMSALLDVVQGRTDEERMQLLPCVDVQGQPIPADRSPFRRVLLCGEHVDGEIVGVRLGDPELYRYLRLTVATLPADGEGPALVVVVSDVSDELRFEHVKRDFLDALAHELKTPVAIAKGYADLLARTAALPDAQLSMVSAITRATDRMHRLIQGLMDVSRLLLGKLSVERTRVALSELVARVVEQVGADARDHPLVVDVRADGIVRGDLLRLEQAVRQIVENAVRAAPEAGRVDLTVDRDAGGVTLAVRDGGPEIRPEDLERVFDLFHWAHADESSGPSAVGVGLFLAREIARRHGGDVRVASRPGEGTTVTLSLPLDEVPP